jgi:hypothetical protein
MQAWIFSVITGISMMLISPISMWFIGRFEPTAMIPAVFGAACVLLGLLARGASMRKHAMHLAALLALLATLGGLGMGASKVVSQLRGQEITQPVAAWSQVAMGLLGLELLVLLILSFVQARNARLARGTDEDVRTTSQLS